MAPRHRAQDFLLKSFPTNLTAKLTPIVGALTRGVKLIDDIEAKKAEMVNAGKLTPAGIAEALTDHARQSIAGLREARHAALTAKERATARRSKIKPEVKDPKDTVAELHRQEIRRVLREAGEDRAMILQTASPRTMEAVLVAEPFVSGISEALHTQLLDQFATANASADIAEINEIENAADAVLAALNEARGELQTVLDLDPVPFNQLAAPIEIETDARLAPKPPERPDPDALKSDVARLSHAERSVLIDAMFNMQAHNIIGGQKAAA
jgi:hypothetical protein